MNEETRALVSEIKESPLTYDKRGEIEESLENVYWILQHDPKLAGIKFDGSLHQLVIDGPVPWDRRGFSNWFNDGDRGQLLRYFETQYHIQSAPKIDAQLQALQHSSKWFNPIQDYFNSLVWDGKPRLDRLLTVTLGCHDDLYTREVIRKTLVAAVARTFEPGIKFDTMLVLVGPQGIGKSSLFNRLAGDEHFSDALSMTDMKDSKQAGEKLAGMLIVEVPELNGMRKAEGEAIKSFITRRDDMYRQSYGRYVERHPRQCIIVGTTNAIDGFLRDETGNRRFWPVYVEAERGRVFELKQEDIDQIWAEAVSLYHKGESLLLSAEAQKIAVKMQTSALEGTTNEDLIKEFLERAVPTGFSSWFLPERFGYWWVLHQADDFNLDLSSFQYKEIRRSLSLGSTEGSLIDCTRARAAIEAGDLEARQYVSVKEVWVECLGKPLDQLDKRASVGISNQLKKLGLTPAQKTSRLNGYGVVKLFEL